MDENNNVVVRVPDQQIIRGEDGYSPVVTIEEIEHGHSVNITDREHPEGQNFDVLDGASAYEQAVAGGYTGTEAQFNEDLSNFKTLHDETEEAAPFYAVYGVTTRSEIYAAINNKRQVYVKTNVFPDAMIVPLTNEFMASDWRTGYRFMLTRGTTQHVCELTSAWTSYANDLSAPAQRAEEAAAQALTRMNSADESAQSAANSASNASRDAGTASTAATTATAKAGEASDSATAADGSAKDAEAYAVGKRGGTDVGSSDPAYHNNAKYYAEQASSSSSDAVTAKGAAETAQGKAEDAQEAAEQAQEAAEAVLESIPSDYTALSEEVDDLKSQLSDVDDRLTTLDGNIFTEWEIGQRYINNGQEAWGVTSARISTKRGTYLNLKAGTVVALKNLQEYQFLIGYSTDGGTTWQGGSNREEPFTLANDCIAFITIRKKSGSFTEEEMNNVATNGIVILIPGSDVTGVNTQIIDGISIGNANFGSFELKASEHGIATQWIGAGLTNYLSATKYGDYIPASKGDVFLISAEESVSYPSLFTSIGLTVYELNSGGTSVRSTDLTDISAPVKYTVQNENTVKICIYGNLKAESTSVTVGYRELFEYKLNIVKQLSSSGIDEVLTEAGDTWEV